MAISTARNVINNNVEQVDSIGYSVSVPISSLGNRVVHASLMNSSTKENLLIETGSGTVAAQSISYANGIVVRQLDVTAFGSPSSTIQMFDFQGSATGNYYLYIQTNGGGSLVTGGIYAVTWNTTTVSLSLVTSVPVVASYLPTSLFAKNNVIYVMYSLTASPFTTNVGRKWDGTTWTTMSGGGLITSVAPAMAISSGNALEHNYYPQVGTSSAYYCLPASTTGVYTGMKFTFATDTWSLYTIPGQQVIMDVSGYLLCYNGGRGTLIDTATDTWLSTTLTTANAPSDIRNAYLMLQFGSSTAVIANSYKGSGILAKATAASSTTIAGVLYSLDTGVSRKTFKLVQGTFNVNAIGSLVVIPVGSQTTANMVLALIKH